MNTNDIEYVIGKTKELLSAGVDVAKPAAVEIVRQVQLYNAAYVALGVSGIIASALLAWRGIRAIQIAENDMCAEFAIGVFMCIGAGLLSILSICSIADHFGTMIAPLPIVLKIIN